MYWKHVGSPVYDDTTRLSCPPPEPAGEWMASEVACSNLTREKGGDMHGDRYATVRVCTLEPSAKGMCESVVILKRKSVITQQNKFRDW